MDMIKIYLALNSQDTLVTSDHALFTDLLLVLHSYFWSFLLSKTMLHFDLDSPLPPGGEGGIMFSAGFFLHDCMMITN
jgi:hypothetical protein